MPAFHGPEPGTQAPHEVARWQWAAMQLAADPDAWEALLRGLPVPRHRLNERALDALGEEHEGDDIKLTDVIALKLEVTLPGSPNGDERHEESPTDLAEGPLAMSARDFTALQTIPPEPLWGTTDTMLLGEGMLAILAARPGTGKTTFAVDLLCHLAAGLAYPPVDETNPRAPSPWPVPRPLRIMLIENEGPLELFRDKLKRKLDAFDNDLARDNIFIQTWRWGGFSFLDEDAFRKAVVELDELKIDLVVGDPLGMLGVTGVGSPEDTRQFAQRLRYLGLTTTRAFLLIHHFRERVENSEDDMRKLSGSWGGHLDTLMTLKADAVESQLQLSFPKLRWARVEPPKAVTLGKVFAIAGFEALALADDIAQHEPKIVETLTMMREQGIGFNGWDTSRHIAERATLGKGAVEKCLKAGDHLFTMKTGEAAQALGARKTAKLFGLKDWLDDDEEDEEPAKPEDVQQTLADPDSDIPF